ncbi:MAG: hypothetical protein ACOYPR_15080, partial [Saprospiraceae bacterium]
MKYLSTTLILTFNLTCALAQSNNRLIITSDIDHFWEAYDKIQTTSDTSLQLEYLNSLFFEKGSEGLPLIMQARRYTPHEYQTAIHKYPLFWSSIRKNTLKS